MHHKAVTIRRVGNMDMGTLETAGKHLGIIAGILGSLAVIWKFVYTPD